MFSAMKYLQPMRVAVERENGLHAFVQWRGRSLRSVAFAAGRWSSSMVMSLPWRSPIVELSQFLTQAASSRGRRILVSGKPLPTVRMERRACGGISCLLTGVFAGATSASVRMHRKRASHSRFVNDAASWRRKLVESQSGQGSREAPGPSVPSRVRFAPSYRKPVWSVLVRTRM